MVRFSTTLTFLGSPICHKNFIWWLRKKYSKKETIWYTFIIIYQKYKQLIYKHYTLYYHKITSIFGNYQNHNRNYYFPRLTRADQPQPERVQELVDPLVLDRVATLELESVGVLARDKADRPELEPVGETEPESADPLVLDTVARY